MNMVTTNSNFDRSEHIKPVIFGVKGLVATADEIELFSKNNPIGFILFSRNIESPEQVKKLIAQLVGTVQPRSDVLVLVDQEGGRVQRLNKPHWKPMPTARHFGQLIKTDGIHTAKRQLYTEFRVCAHELKKLGFNMDCVPMLDVDFTGADNIMGDRCYSSDPKEIAELGGEVCRALLMGNVFPVLKHIPGHGRAKADSHKELPVVDAPLDELIETDFVPFKELSIMPFAMTAHIKYTAIDAENCATQSKKVIDLIRNQIGFHGMIMTDDLSMHALEGTFTERVQKSLAAGCEIILHCNGDFTEMVEIAEATPFMPKTVRDKYRACWKHFRH
jgi:beta-N-acetylhexosaminidase